MKPLPEPSAADRLANWSVCAVQAIERAEVQLGAAKLLLDEINEMLGQSS